jgi:predicted PurR-regulated permease PerM
MLLVGGMTAAGLWLIGVPAFLGLGLIAGLTEFIPILGPIAGVVPAPMLASAQDWVTVAWVFALFVVIQQVENNVIPPLLTGRTVQMLAAVGIFARLAMGVLFGPLGLLFGYPLAIVADLWVRKLYVRELLEKDTTLPSESQEPDPPGRVRQTRGSAGVPCFSHRQPG